MDVKQTLWLIFWLNALDGVFTALWLILGVAEEANPLLKPFVNNVIYFIVLKVTWPSLMLTVLWHFRENGFADVGSQILAFVYIVVTFYHMHISIKVLTQVL